MEGIGDMLDESCRIPQILFKCRLSKNNLLFEQFEQNLPLGYDLTKWVDVYVAMGELDSM